MQWPPNPMFGNWTLTGATKVRFSWCAKRLIVVVEEGRPCGPATTSPDRWTQRDYRWRDAKPGDVLEIGFGSFNMARKAS